ncbi:MAG: L,D-transpeptidase, partial [Chloroflexota bacterium]
FAQACAGITVESPVPSDLCRQVMAARPAPSYDQVRTDYYTIDTYSFYRVTGESPDVFAAPGGAVTRNMGAGFNFIQAVDTSVEGWVQIQGGEWMRASDLTYVQPSLLRGFQIDDGLADPFAWILGNVITAPYPGGPQDISTGVRKYYYNPVNIYATVEVDGWRWYMIGPDQWVEQRNVSKPTIVERPEGVSGRWVSVDLYEQSMVAYQDDEPVFATVIASGLPEWATNEGLFEVWYRLPAGEMSGAFGAPDAYALQSVPWTLYFDGDISLHGAYWHDAFGFRRSHGCVNMSISDSRWLYEWLGAAEGPLDEDGKLRNFVYVHSSGEYV